MQLTFGVGMHGIMLQSKTTHIILRDVDYYSSKGMAGVDFRAKNYDSIENLEKIH